MASTSSNIAGQSEPCRTQPTERYLSLSFPSSALLGTWRTLTLLLDIGTLIGLPVPLSLHLFRSSYPQELYRSSYQLS
ncbi:unnamed protein product [Tuber melanosporum]|uniref:(Perigord truffle) hypothetical protein n=1 Tax=Tuber melanosporum (strain Mel28) TaxID=656061 RepID=D5G690_TUBMM|nr:uncharacterized protein GSTUM_00001659001 [Tuber melanosporum]CAZ80033.1 unnamed protein product [Tuber melanosporum]